MLGLLVSLGGLAKTEGRLDPAILPSLAAKHEEAQLLKVDDSYHDDPWAACLRIVTNGITNIISTRTSGLLIAPMTAVSVLRTSLGLDDVRAVRLW
jgi:hypothetical protein